MLNVLDKGQKRFNMSKFTNPSDIDQQNINNNNNDNDDDNDNENDSKRRLRKKKLDNEEQTKRGRDIYSAVPIATTPSKTKLTKAQREQLEEEYRTSTVSARLPTALPSDNVHLSLQVRRDGEVYLSILVLEPRQPTSFSYTSSSTSSISAPTAPSLTLAAKPLTYAPLPPVRIRIIDSKLTEQRNGNPFITYLVEYEELQTEGDAETISSTLNTSPLSPSPSVHVCGKRFNDFFALHQKLSESFTCLPPFPSKTFRRTVSSAELIENRKEALMVYMQLLVMRQDILRHRVLQRFLGVDPEDTSLEGAFAASSSSSSSSTSSFLSSLSSASKNADDQSFVLQEKDQQKYKEQSKERMKAKEPPPIWLLYEQHNVIKTSLPDIDAIKESETQEQELRQTIFSSRTTASENFSKKAKKIVAIAGDESLQSAKNPKPALPSIASITVSFRSPVFSMRDCIILDAQGQVWDDSTSQGIKTLLLIGGDDSSLSKIDVMVSSWWSSWKSKLEDKDKKAKEMRKEEKYVDPDIQKKEAEKKPIMTPLGSLYIYQREDEENAKWQYVSSFFFEREVTGICYDHRNGHIYLSKDNGQVDIYHPLQNNDFSSLTRLRTIQLHVKSITAMYLSTENDSLFTISLNQKGVSVIHRFDLLSLCLVSAITHSNTKALSISYQVEKDRLFIGSADKNIYIYEAGKLNRPSKLLALLKGHEGAVDCVTYDPSTHTLASGAQDHSVFLWQIPSEKGSEANSHIVARLVGHQSKITTLSFSPNLRYLLSGDADGCIVIWSRLTAMGVLSWQAHQGPVYSIRLSNMELISTSEDRFAKVWTLY